MRLTWNQISLLNFLLAHGTLSTAQLKSWEITQQTVNSLRLRLFIETHQISGNHTLVRILPYGELVMKVLNAKLVSSTQNIGEDNSAYYERIVRTIKVEDLASYKA
jgi:hypothetical protein